MGKEIWKELSVFCFFLGMRLQNGMYGREGPDPELGSQMSLQPCVCKLVGLGCQATQWVKGLHSGIKGWTQQAGIGQIVVRDPIGDPHWERSQMRTLLSLVLL